MPDITSSQVSLDQRAALPPEEDRGSVQAVITRGWNAYLVQVVLVKNGETRMLVGKEVVSYTVAEGVARVSRPRTVFPGRRSKWFRSSW